MNHKFSTGTLLKKCISLIVASTFLFSNIVFADSPKTIAIPDAQKQQETITDPSKIVIPRDFGLVKSTYTGKENKLIIHIQDAHCNYEAQSNIKNILESLIKNDGLSLISVEGADGFIDTSWFKAFPDADIRKEVADYFMKKGEITGPEFLSITSDYPIKLFGAETRSYYIENLNAFTSSYPLKEPTEKYFNQIKSIVNKLKGYIYNEELRTLDSKMQDYESKKLQFSDYVKYLESLAVGHKINLRQYESLFKLISVFVYEKKINFNIVDKERSSLIDALTKKLSKDTLTELVTSSLSFKTGKISSAEYYAYLKGLAQANGFQLSTDYPNLFNYIIYNSVYSRIENDKLFGDIKKLEVAIKEKLFVNDDQRTLDKLSHYVDILLGLVNIKLLNDDFDYYKANKDEFVHDTFAVFINKMTTMYGLAIELEGPSDTVKDSMSKLEDFYSIAIKRDKAMVDNTIQAMNKENARICVLVTGGFHSEGMTKMLESQGVSYMVVCPNITKDVETPYIQILTNQRTPLEDILTDTGIDSRPKVGTLAPFSIAEAIAIGRPISIKAATKLDKILSGISAGLPERVKNFVESWNKEYVRKWIARADKFAGKRNMSRDQNVLTEAFIIAYKNKTGHDVSDENIAAIKSAFAKVFAERQTGSLMAPPAEEVADSETIPSADGVRNTMAGSDTSIREKTHGAPLTDDVIDEAIRAAELITIFEDGQFVIDISDGSPYAKYAKLVEYLKSAIESLDTAIITGILSNEHVQSRRWGPQLASIFTRDNLLSLLQKGRGFRIVLVKPAGDVPGIIMTPTGSNFGHYSVNPNYRSEYVPIGFIDMLLAETDNPNPETSFLKEFVEAKLKITSGLMEVAVTSQDIRQFAQNLIAAELLHEMTEYLIVNTALDGAEPVTPVNPDDFKIGPDGLVKIEAIAHFVAQLLEEKIAGKAANDVSSFLGEGSMLDDVLAKVVKSYNEGRAIPAGPPQPAAEITTTAGIEETIVSSHAGFPSIVKFVNRKNGKELTVRIVRNTQGATTFNFCKIGNRTYQMVTDEIDLMGLLRVGSVEDILGWIGNKQLLDFFDLSPMDVLRLNTATATVRAKPYLYDTLKEPISRISDPEIYPENVSLEDLREARDYLNANQYIPSAGFDKLLERLHYVTILSRSNATLVTDYNQIIDDMVLVTENLTQLELNDSGTIRSLASVISGSISIAVVRSPKPEKPLTSDLVLRGREAAKLQNKEPFVIENPEEDLPRLEAIASKLIVDGQFKPYVIVNIKNFSGTTHLAYIDFVKTISAKYNGNITFILSIENPRALRGDLAGTYTARRRTIDIFGDKFWLEQRIITEPDGGEKTRAANAGVAFEQWSKTLTTDGIPFLEDNVITSSVLWLLLPKLGMGNNGQNYKPWLASDGRIRFGKMNLAERPISQIPDDLQLAACGLDALVMTEDQMSYVRTKIGEEALRQGSNFDDIFEEELRKILYNTSVGEAVRANIDKRELIKRGIFVIDRYGIMTGFLEKGGGEHLPIATRYVNTAALAYRQGGKVLENLWLILEDSRTSLDIIKRFGTTRTEQPSEEEIIGRVPKVSSFQEMFQGFVYKTDRPWAKQVEQALTSGKIYGISYGEGMEAADIASIENYFDMWDRYVREYNGEKEIDVASSGVEIRYRGDKNKIKYLLRNVRIIGAGVLEIGDGVVIQGGVIKVDGMLKIPDRAKIVDSQLVGPIEFIGEGALALAVSFEPNKYRYMDRGIPTNKIVFYGDETTTTQTYSDGTSHVVRFINSVDYKIKIINMVGGADRWNTIRDMFGMHERRYDDFRQVVRMRLEDVIKNESSWVDLVEFIFAPTLSPEGLGRANSEIEKLAQQFRRGEIDLTALREGVHDVMMSLVSARFTITDEDVLDNDISEMVRLVSSSVWSHHDLDQVILRSYENRVLPQIMKALETVIYERVKNEPYGKALYRILAAMHPAIISNVDHGDLSWNVISMFDDEKEERAFFDIPLYGGRNHEEAKRDTDSFAMGWILGTRTRPAGTHLSGALRMNGGGLTPEEHGTRTKDKVRNRSYRLEKSVNGAVGAVIQSGNAYGINIEEKYGDVRKANDADLTGVNIGKLDALKKLIEHLDVRVIVLKGLKKELMDRKRATDLIFHPGVGRKSVYLDEEDFKYLMSLENGVDLMAEAVNHEKAHILNPTAKEADIEKLAPTYNVRYALSLKPVSEVRAKLRTEQNPIMKLSDRAFTEGQEYAPGKIYRRPLARFTEFGTSGVRWLVEGMLEFLKNTNPKKYNFLLSNGYTQEDFTTPNVALITKSIALYNLRKAQGYYPPIVGTTEEFAQKLESKGLFLMYDNRPGAKEKAQEAARVLAAYGIKSTMAFFDNQYFPTPIPLMSLLIKKEGYAGGICFTASHNGDEWNGIKFNAEDGAPGAPSVTGGIGSIMNEEFARENPGYDIVGEKTSKPEEVMQELMSRGMIKPINTVELYTDEVFKYIGKDRVVNMINALNDGKAALCMSAFYGSSGPVAEKLLTGLARRADIQLSDRARVSLIETNKPGDVYIESYEPCLEKLVKLQEEVKKAVAETKGRTIRTIVIGGAADNDADRFQVSQGIFDEQGNAGIEEYMPQRLTAILGHYLATSRGINAPWGRSFVSSTYQDSVARLFDQGTIETPTGFKYARDVLLDQDGTIFSEESYGLSFHGWTMDKDGILPIILALELVTNTGMSLDEYENKVVKRDLESKDIPSEFVFERDDMRLDGETKGVAVATFTKFYEGIPADMQADGIGNVSGDVQFAGQKVVKKYDADKWGGMKLVMADGSWIAFRSSKTEPIIRFYLEGSGKERIGQLRAALRQASGIAERLGGVEVGEAFHAPLIARGSTPEEVAALRAGGKDQGGYGVGSGDSVDGSFAIGDEGKSGYYVTGGTEKFISDVQKMRDFFTNRNKKNKEAGLGPIKYVIKVGIGGQHTAFQGIAEVLDVKTGKIVGEYELGKDYEKSLSAIKDQLGLKSWSQMAIIPSSKSGSTDETMLIFVNLLNALIKNVAAEHEGGSGGMLYGSELASVIMKTLHDVNFIDGVERPGADLFKVGGDGSLINLIVKNARDNRFETTAEDVKIILGRVLGNMIFETVNNPAQSRLAAFIKNSGLSDSDKGGLDASDLPVFIEMFDNVGGRWTGDLHMMLFLAYQGFTDKEIEAYWQTRFDGIQEVRSGTHTGNKLGNKILDEAKTDIAFVVPDNFFWFGKSIEQNFNESIWQNGFAKLVAIKESKWNAQKRLYAGKSNRLIINLSGLPISGDNVVSIEGAVGLENKTPQEQANEMGKLFTTFYGMTNTVGNRLIARALHDAGYTVADVVMSDLDNPATKIVQRNLYLRQPYVELGKGLLETELKRLQTSGEIEDVFNKSIEIANDKSMPLTTNIEGFNSPGSDVTGKERLKYYITEGMKTAEAEDRIFVPILYLGGKNYIDLRDYLVDLGIEWVMQGTGDQHISYQQVLAQSKKYLPFIISFLPKTRGEVIEGLPAVGFAKGYLHNVSPNMVRDLFADFSYKALTEPRKDEAGQPVVGGLGMFMRMTDTNEDVAMLKDAFTEAVAKTNVAVIGKAPDAGRRTMAGERPEAPTPFSEMTDAEREEYLKSTYVSEQEQELFRTLDILNQLNLANESTGITLILATDQDLNNGAQAGLQIGSQFLEETLGRKSVIRVTGRGGNALAGKISEHIKQLNSENKKYAIVVLGAGNIEETELLEMINAANERSKDVSGMRPRSALLKIQNDNKVTPMFGILELALKLGYGFDEGDILDCLNRIGIKPGAVPGEAGVAFTDADLQVLLRNGIIRILPRITAVDTNEISAANEAQAAALRSL